MTHPVVFDVERPPTYQRAQLALRFLLLFLMAAVGSTLGWLFGILYLALPTFAAAVISQRGGERYLAESAPQVVGFLRWVMAVYAYLGLVTDRVPLFESDLGVTLEVAPAGTPTTKSALMRLLRSLPAALALFFLGIVSAFLWVFGALGILFWSTVPEPIFDFQRGVLRWQARLFAFHASLVDVPSPFSFDTGGAPDAAASR